MFKLHAIDLGTLKKLKIWHDNKGGGGAWFLDYVEVTSNYGPLLIDNFVLIPVAIYFLCGIAEFSPW